MILNFKYNIFHARTYTYIRTYSHIRTHTHIHTYSYAITSEKSLRYGMEPRVIGIGVITVIGDMDGGAASVKGKYAETL